MDEDAEEQPFVVDPLIAELAAKNKVVLSGNPCCPGCGCLLGLKLALQALDIRVLVLSRGCMGLLTDYPPSVTTVRLSANAVAVAGAIARSHAPVLVYAGDGATRLYLASVAAAAARNDNVLYICYNNLGSCATGMPGVGTAAPSVNAAYAATAAVSHPEDYLRKLRKAAQTPGFRFIEVLTPCPRAGFNAANTIEVSRAGVESGFWPLYEVQSKRIEVTYKPPRRETVERFIEMQERLAGLTPQEKQKIIDWVKEGWKMVKWA